MVKITNLFKTKRESVILFAVSLFAVIFAMFLVSNQKDKLLEGRRTLGVLQSDFANLEKIYKDYQVKDRQLSRVRGSVPSSYDEVRIYAAKVIDRAQMLGLTPEIRFDQDGKIESTGGSSVGVSIEVPGTYPQLTTYVREIGNLPYHTRVENLTYSENEDGSIVMAMTYKIYIK